jgi:PmbA protein
VAVLKKDEMLSLAEKTVTMAQKKGAAEAEAYVNEGQSTSIGLERGQITKSSRIIDRGLGVRVSINKAIGFAYTNVLEKQAAVEDSIVRALNAAKASKPDKDWHGLPEKKPFGSAANTYDQKIVDLRSEDIVNLTTRMLDAAIHGDKRVLAIEGGAGSGVLSTAIANSNGISAFDKGTMMECSVATVANSTPHEITMLTPSGLGKKPHDSQSPPSKPNASKPKPPNSSSPNSLCKSSYTSR